MLPFPQEPLGASLKNARESLGHTLEDVVKHTHLPHAVIEALEAEDMGFFASPLYARSFLKQYGQYLEFDISPWLDALVSTSLVDAHAADCYVQDLSKVTSNKAQRQTSTEQVELNGNGGKFASLLLIIITALMVWLGIELYEKPNKATQTPDDLPAENVIKPLASDLKKP